MKLSLARIRELAKEAEKVERKGHGGATFKLFSTLTPETVTALVDEIERLKRALEDLVDTPWSPDTASVPKCGIEKAPPYQVVGTMSVCWTKIQNMEKALAAHREAFE